MSTTPIITLFERADMRNDVEWFDKYFEKNYQELHMHFRITDGIFDWKNFKAWKKGVYDEYGRAYRRLLELQDSNGKPLWEKCDCNSACDNIPRGLTRTIIRDNETLKDDMDRVYSDN